VRNGKGQDDERALTIGIDAFNVLNRVKYVSSVGNLSSPLSRPGDQRAAAAATPTVDPRQVLGDSHDWIPDRGSH